MEKKHTVSFEAGSISCSNLNTWWRGLAEQKGERAELRRCHALVQVVFVPSYHALLSKMTQVGYFDKERLAMIAGVAAHVRIDNPSARMAAQLSKQDNGAPKLSPLRFRRILAITENEELYEAMIRLVQYLKGTVNLCDMAQSIYWWNDNTKKRWAYEYYNDISSKKNEPKVSL